MLSLFLTICYYLLGLGLGCAGIFVAVKADGMQTKSDQARQLVMIVVCLLYAIGSVILLLKTLS